MPEPDSPSVDLERPRVAVRHVADLRGHGIGEAKLIRGYQAIRHDPHTVPSCQRCNGGIQIDRRWPIQHVADPGHVVQAVAHPAQPSRLDETRQSLVDGLAAAEVQEVSGRAHPASAIVGGHPLPDLVGDSSHWITFIAFGCLLVRVSEIYTIYLTISRMPSSGESSGSAQPRPE